MPIYEYSCPKCGTFEHYQKFTDPALTECPVCHEPVQKLISRNIGVIYKAGGYYVSDHRSSDYKQKAREDGSSGSAGSSSGVAGSGGASGTATTSTTSGASKPSTAAE